MSKQESNVIGNNSILRIFVLTMYQRMLSFQLEFQHAFYYPGTLLKSAQSLNSKVEVLSLLLKIGKGDPLLFIGYRNPDEYRIICNICKGPCGDFSRAVVQQSMLPFTRNIVQRSMCIEIGMNEYNCYYYSQT